jgi:predicted Ser/Thr protein kinase
MAGKNGSRNDVAEYASRCRPAWLRALGHDDPPDEITVDDERYRRVDIYKHDSWAATALYESVSPVAKTRRIIGKFNRRQSLLGLPGAWIGRLLARREAHFLSRLAETGFVPQLCGAVWAEGRLLPNAVARKFIDGHALKCRERTSDEFFGRLREVLQAIHAYDVAYVDLHKHENVLVGADGRPYLIDFQVSFGLMPTWWGRSRPARLALQMLQRMDDYILTKLHRRHRRDQCPLSQSELDASRPLLVRVHRRLAAPLRQARRRLLVLLGVRARRGKVESERFVEVGLRESISTAA